LQRSSWSARFSVVCIGIVSFSLVVFLGGTASAAPPEQRLVWLRARSSEQVQQWVDGGLDVWQVAGDRVLAQLTQKQFASLEQHNLDFEPAPEWGMPAFPACYRTYSDSIVLFHELQGQYPNLFRLYDVGDGWEKVRGTANRDIFAVRLTNYDIHTEKPKLFITAEHHAREIITVEVALQFIEDLLLNYDQDPQIRWLLDNREVWVMPMTNPDGYERVTQMADWRKNTDRPQLCPNGQPPNSFGVDLNRNYGYQWGLDIGSSSEPCNLTYRGNVPFSEPETQAVRDLVEQERFNLLLSLHSYGDEILYPWGYTYLPAPDAEDLYRIAYRMAQASGYVAMQASGVGYLGSGDTLDWAYGELGIPSFTFEIGGMEDGFFWPDCVKRQELYNEIRNALVYAAMIADDPFGRANGPDIRQLAWEIDKEQVVISAQADDTWNGDDAIARIELFFDTLGEPGTGVPAAPTDGSFSSAREWGVFRLALSEVPADAAVMYLRAQDARGHWGPPKVAAVSLLTHEPPTVTPTATLPSHGPTPRPSPTSRPPGLTPIAPTSVPATPTVTPVKPHPTPAIPLHPQSLLFLPLIRTK